MSIPIKAAKEIAQRYGYDQIVVVARKIGDGGHEHVTTYGVDKANCDVAARIGEFFKYKLMGWEKPTPPSGKTEPCASCGVKEGVEDNGLCAHCNAPEPAPDVAPCGECGGKRSVWDSLGMYVPCPKCQPPSGGRAEA